MKNNDFQEKFNKDDRLAKDYIAQMMNLKISGEQKRDNDRFFKCNIKCSFAMLSLQMQEIRITQCL